MSELIQKNKYRSFHRQLLTGVSALALIGYVATMPVARADDGNLPTIWIELGGQFNRLENSQEIYTPPFVALTPSNFSPPQIAERPARYGLDETAALTFQPEESDWVFSASVRYGRSGNSKHVRQQSNPAPYTAFTSFHRSRNGNYHHFTHYYVNYAADPRFVDVTTKHSEGHTILDFQAGKDFGLGLFGHNASSTLNIGVRFAQFTSRSAINIRENPDWHFKTHITTFSTSYDYNGSHYSFYHKVQNVNQPYHSFAGAFRANRSFTGLGPSISWKSSEPFAGNPERGALTFDWGLNAALLFGRQKAKTHHQTTAWFHSTYANQANRPITYQHPVTPDHARSRNVIVPNIGGFAGLSVKYNAAKVSVGYRADFFFGAMDGGIDARRNENVGFYGPFATVSVGLGG
jgi:hypothetical protein